MNEDREVDVQDVIDEADSNMSIHLDWSDMWFKLLKLDKSDSISQEKLDWEYIMFNFSFSIDTFFDNNFQTDDVNDTILDYFSDRLNKTSNPVFKVKYCDFILRFKMNFQTLADNLKYYSQLVEFCFQDEKYHINEIGAEILERKLELSVKLFLGTKNDDELQSSVESHYKILNKVEKFESKSIISLALVQSLFSLKSELWKYSKPSQLLPIIEKNIMESADEYSQISNGFLVILIEFHNRQGNKEKKIEAMIMNAKRKENYFQFLAKEGASHLHLASVATEIYNMFKQIPGKNSDVKESLDKFKKLVRDHYREAQQKEFTIIKDDQTIPAEPFKQYLEDHYFNKPIQDQLRQMSVDPDFFPDFAYCLMVCKEHNPIVSMFSTTYLDEDGGVQHRSDNKDDFATTRAKTIFLSFLQLIITASIKPIFEKISTEANLLKSMDTFFEKDSIITKSRYKLIRHGIERYRNADYISSTHILVFQIEGILRDLLGTVGIPTFRIDKDGLHSRFIAQDIIPKLDELENFDENLKMAFEVVLFHPHYDKIRHLIAHGLYPFERYTQELNICLVFLLIRLNAMNYKTKS